MTTTLPRLTVPDPAETADLTMSDGAVVHLRRHGDPAGPRIAFSHGNGLAIDAYYPFWRQLLDRYDVILFDVRNHGWNPVHDLAAHNWDRIAADFEETFHGIAAAFGDKPVIGAFHSLSSIAALMHIQRAGPRWSLLVLFDPPLFPRDKHPLQKYELQHMREMAALARRRPERYGEPADFADQLRGRRIFARWLPGAHLLFAEATLRPAEDGADYVLCCPKEYEARIFENNVDPTIWPALRDCPAPVKIIGSDPDLPDQQAPAFLSRGVAEDYGLDYTMVPDTTHFLQIEKPGDVLAALEIFLRTHGAAS